MIATMRRMSTIESGECKLHCFSWSRELGVYLPYLAPTPFSGLFAADAGKGKFSERTRDIYQPHHSRITA